jgi:hypothetical protein
MDGDLDMAGAGMGAPGIRVWINDGEQNFSPEYVGGSFSSGFCLNISDFDGDTDEDIVALSYSGGRISFFENNLINPFLIANPESVVFDHERGRYLVSNTNGNNAGFITAIDGDKNMSYFIENMGSPLGMCIAEDKLLVSEADSDSIFGFNLETSEKVFAIRINATGNLDGQAYDNNGHLYVIDTYGRIFKVYLETGKFSLFVSNGLMQYPQDCIYDSVNNRLIVVGWSSQSDIIGVNLEDSTTYTIKETFYGYYDGITQDQFGNVYLSSHYNMGLVLRYSPDFSGDPEIISTNHDEPAGLNYNVFDNILVVPNYGSSELDFIKISVTGCNHEQKVKGSLLYPVYPNPFQNNTNIEFYIDERAKVTLEVFDVLGEQIDLIINRFYLPGLHKLYYNSDGLSSDTYILGLRVNDKLVSSQLMIRR